MSRLDRFLILQNHPWLGRSFKKLSKHDLQFAIYFINSTNDLDVNIYCHKVVRIFLDNPNKPKAWKEIEELLIAAK